MPGSGMRTLGCIPFDSETATLFFALISSRYERRS